MKKLALVLCSILVFPAFSGCKKQEAELPRYTMNLTLGSDMTVSGSLQYDFTSFNEGLQSLCFNLYANAFSDKASVSPVYKKDLLKAYPNGFSAGKTEILSVKTNGEEVKYFVGGENEQFLEVFFNKRLKKGEKASIYVEFKNYLPNVNHRYGYGNDTVNLTGFYPIACVWEKNGYVKNVYYPAGDPFYSENADYSVSLTVPSEYTVASSLTPIKTVWSGGDTEYVYERKRVKDIAFILSKRYNVLKGNADGVIVSYYYYADENPEKTLQTACDAVLFFSDKFYKYPYSDYAVCQADFIYGGMEYPCLSLISDEVGSFLDYTVAHETAHQWFYGIMGVNESEEGYLDEGLTEFATAVFMDGREGKTYRDYVTEAENSYKAIKNALKYVGVTTPPVMARNLKEFTSEAEYVMIAYDRSMVMIDRLKTRLGDRKFYKTLKKFIEENAFRNVSGEEFISAFERSKRGSGEFLRDFIDGKVEI